VVGSYPITAWLSGERPFPSETRAFLEAAGFQDIVVEDTGAKYLAAYKQRMSLAASRTMPALGIHVFAGSATA